MAPATATSALRRPAEVVHAADGVGRVDGRLGVGHGHHRGVAAERAGPSAGLDGLGLLPARLAQVGVQVDEPGADQHPPASSTAAPAAASRSVPTAATSPSTDEHVGRGAARLVDDGAAPDEQLGRPAGHRPLRH